MLPGPCLRASYASVIQAAKYSTLACLLLAHTVAVQCVDAGDAGH
jgi:hypothetical protein